MKKHILLTLSGLGAAFAATPVAVSAGCGNQAVEKHPKAINEKEQVTNIELRKEYKKAIKDYKVAMITDGGSETDKSFNQSAWEAVCKTGESLGLSAQRYNIFKVDNSKFDAMYASAFANGYKVWVLPGFLHATPIREYINNHKAEMLKKGIILVTVDFNGSNKLKDADYAPGLYINLTFNTKEGGYMAGYAAGKFLSTNKEEIGRTVTSFGGGQFEGVTDFNEGFYKGLIKWNSEQKDKSTKIKSFDGNEVNLSTGFSGPDLNNTAKNYVDRAVKLIFPVAGPATELCYNRMTDDSKYIIGVDTNQALSAGAKSKIFLTSVLKNIGQATYDALGAILCGDKTYIKTFDEGKTSQTLFGDAEMNLTGIADSTIEGEKAAEAKAAVEAGRLAFKNITKEDKAWLESGKVNASDAKETEDLQIRINNLSALVKF